VRHTGNLLVPLKMREFFGRDESVMRDSNHAPIDVGCTERAIHPYRVSGRLVISMLFLVHLYTIF